MARPDLTLAISKLMRVKVDLKRKRAVILAKTDDGKLVRVKVGYKILNRIHDENRNQMAVW